MFNPSVVALIGATDRPGSVGLTVLENLLLGTDRRRVYAVNPNRNEVKGLKCYASVKDVPEHVDLAVVATPAKTVPEVVRECGEAGVEGVCIISAGFRETGEEGRRLEEEIERIRQAYGLRILGPNCMGFIRPTINLNASFFSKQPEKGQIAFISQSGALGSAILDWAVSRHIGFSMFASLGSMLDIDFGDLIDFLGQDPYTKSILLYMENVGNARKFMSAARGFARNKPIIVIKPGKSETAARAAHSHTGAMVGNFEVYRAAFRRAGVVRVDDVQDLFNCAAVLDSRHLPEGPNLCIITNAGGPGVLAADAVEEYGGAVATLSEKTLTALDAVLPSYWSRGNPVDVLGDADVKRYATALRICLADPGVDGAIVIYTPQGAANPNELAEAIVTVLRESTRLKPVLTVWMGGEAVNEARRVMLQNDIPTYETPEEAVKTYIYMYKYKRNLELLYETPEDLPIDPWPPKNFLKIMIRKALNEGRILLNIHEADKFLDVYGIPRAPGEFVSSVEEALSAANKLGYPVALKIVSPDVVHKTEFGAVMLNIASPAELKTSFLKLAENLKNRNPAAQLQGFYVQKMVKPIHYEIILGMKNDRDFGRVIMFGAGGTFTEFLKDVAVGLPPLNQVIARRLIEETRIYKVLQKGFRGKPAADMKKIEEAVVRFSNIVVDFPEIKEIDINPMIVSDDGVYAVDCRIVLDREATETDEPYRHLVITPYPTKYVRPWRLKDGRQVLLRPIKPEDEQIEYELIKGLSEESSRFRFFQVIRDITHDMLVRFCNIDYDREMAIIAEYVQDGKIRNVGVGRLIIDPDGKRGEFAVVVADDFQGKGLGTKLIDILIEVALEKKLSSIYGIILPENLRMINLCRKLGFEVKHRGEDVYVELKLHPETKPLHEVAEKKDQPKRPEKTSAEKELEIA